MPVECRGIALFVSAMFLFNLAASHGYLFSPPARQRLAYDAHPYSPETDYCLCRSPTLVHSPHCTLATPVLAESDVVDVNVRPYPGNRPFAEPGTAPSVNFVGSNGLMFGVCGTQKNGSNNYNIPSPGGVWGNASDVEYKATYQTELKAGEVVDVSWCVNADHGGIYSWRLCDDQRIVSKFWGSEPLSEEEQIEAEECFQKGILRCDDVAENDCSLEPRCQESWGCAAEPGKYFHCDSSDAGDVEKIFSCANTDEACYSGTLVKRKVKIPKNFPSGPTILSWRWDSDETAEVFAACSDVTILESEQTPTYEPTTAAPTLTTVPTQAETPVPTAHQTTLSPTEASGICCWWPETPDMCSNCESLSPADDWCAESEERCSSCGGTWCRGVGVDSPIPGLPEPVPAPTVRPPNQATPLPTEPSGICCWWPETADICTICESSSPPNDYCAQSEDRCSGCGGTWCQADDIGNPVSATAVPTLEETTNISTTNASCYYEIVDGAPNNDEPNKCEGDEGLDDVEIADPDRQMGGVRCCNDNGHGTSICTETCELTDYWTAQLRCQEAGMRLCTKEEVSDRKVAGTGCLYDFVKVWTVETCVETPSPTAKYGYPGDNDVCCFAGGCDTCYAPVSAPYWCGRSAENCEDCGGEFCPGSVSAPTALPSESTTAMPVASANCFHEIVDGAADNDVPNICEGDEGLDDVELADPDKQIGGVRCCNENGGGSSICTETCELTDYWTAQLRCQDAGLRLCTKQEVLDKNVAGTGCLYDFVKVWTVETCVETPAPTAKYGYSGEDDLCCFAGSCDTCYAPVTAPYWCGRSADNCMDCGGEFCPA